MTNETSDCYQMNQKHYLLKSKTSRTVEIIFFFTGSVEVFGSTETERKKERKKEREKAEKREAKVRWKDTNRGTHFCFATLKQNSLSNAYININTQLLSKSFGKS
jgi:hypothetical protein